MCKISLSFRFRISLSDMTNYKSAFGKVCRIKNRQTFKSMPILNSAYHAVKYAELRIGILLKVCRFVIRHITQTDTETETELLRRHVVFVCLLVCTETPSVLFWASSSLSSDSSCPASRSSFTSQRMTTTSTYHPVMTTTSPICTRSTHRSTIPAINHL